MITPLSVARKLIVYLATSADGYIARPDGGVEWLDRKRPPGNYGMAEFMASVDTKIMGRKTFDFAMANGGPALFRGKEYYVFTNQSLPEVPGVTFVSGSARKLADELRSRKGKDIWLMGGGGLIASFLDEGVVDEFIIHVLPVLIGEGIPLLAPRHRLVRLELIGSETFPDGVVRHHYRPR